MPVLTRNVEQARFIHQFLRHSLMEPLTVSGTLDSLKTIAAYVLSAAENAGLEKKPAYKLRLAVDEIATNIIVHGYEEAGRSGDINLTAHLDDSALTITLQDTGIPYDPYQYQGPDSQDLDLALEDRPIGGLGVFLAVEGVDKFAYEFVDNHNLNHFTLNLPTSPIEASSSEITVENKVSESSRAVQTTR